MGNFFTELMRRLFGLLDHIVIFLIETLYSLLIQIADTNVLGDIIYHYLGRIYTFLGIFMLFKLSFSMINYIVNPDALTDKSKGFGKLISNVIISLILLVATPNIFNMAFDIQSDILKSNAVYQIITGYKLESTDDIQNNSKIMGKRLAFGVYSTFVYDNKIDPMEEETKASDVKALTDTQGNTCDTDDPYCLVKADTITLKSADEFVNQYWYLISTICGVAVAYMLLTFCFDAAVRAIKLGVLQIIAPIPILSMIDPKKGTDQVMKWAKEAGKTFADLFIRLAGLFFAIDIISAILNASETPGVMTSYSGGYNVAVNNIFVRLFVIIGCLMFAKQLPQFIENVLGIKMSGDGFSLKKKLGGIPGVGVAKALGAGALGFAGGMAANTLAGFNRKNYSWDKNKGIFRNIGHNALGFGKHAFSAAGGGVSGLGRGAFSKEKSLWKAGAAGVAGAVGARNLRADRVTAGDGGPKGYIRRAGVGISNWAGVESGASKFDKQLATLDKYKGFKKQLKDLSDFDKTDVSKESFMAGYNADILTAATGGTKGLKQYYEDLQNSGTATQGEITNARKAYEESQEWIITKGNDQINAVKAEAARYVKENSDVLPTDKYSTKANASYKDINDGFIAASNETVKIKSSAEYNQAQINKKNDAKK